METATLYTILTIIGSVIIILLSINAFFIKALVDRLGRIEINFVQESARNEAVVSDVKDNKARILLLEQDRASMKERLHTLEGANVQLLALADKIQI